jgi:nucleoside-diphosphate-sugar epimerase
VSILLTGAAGALGRALDATLRELGHHVLTVGRTSGDLRYDLTDPIGSRPCTRPPARWTPWSAPPAPSTASRCPR